MQSKQPPSNKRARRALLAAIFANKQEAASNDSSFVEEALSEASCSADRCKFDSSDAISWLTKCATEAGHKTVATALALSQLAEKQSTSVTIYRVKDLAHFGLSENAVRRHLEKLSLAGMFEVVECRRRGFNKAILPFAGSKTDE